MVFKYNLISKQMHLFRIFWTDKIELVKFKYNLELWLNLHKIYQALRYSGLIDFLIQGKVLVNIPVIDCLHIY